MKFEICVRLLWKFGENAGILIGDMTEQLKSISRQ